MAGTLKETSVNVAYAAGENTTTINVSFIYESTAALTTAALVTSEILTIVKKVPNKPPGGKQNFNLRSCSANQTSGSKTAFTASATYDDKTLPKDGEGGGGEGDDPDGGGGRGSCHPPKKETVSTIKAIKDFPLKNNCDTPIMPSPQIEVTLIQRTVVDHFLGTDTGQAQNDLRNGIGKIDMAETRNQNGKLGIDQRDKDQCPPDENAPAPGINQDQQFRNRPCGSLLASGSIGAVEQGPCGPFYSVTKTFIDGDFQAPGIFQADFIKCGYGGNNALHTGTHNGVNFPIVALRGIGGVIAWPGQPAINDN